MEKTGIKEPAKLKGKFSIAVLDKKGNTKESFEIPNTVMNAGIAEVTGLMLEDVGGTAFDYLAIGTGNSAPNATETALVGEKYRSAGTGSQETDTITDDTAQLTTSISITSSISIQEAGVFNSSSAGTMLARTTFSAVNVNDGDTVNLGYGIILS